MKPVSHFWPVFLLTVLPSVAVAAGGYSWFDGGSAAADPLGLRTSAFGLEVYRSTGDAEGDTAAAPGHTVRLYGDYSARDVVGGDQGDRRFTKFGLRWQHRVSAQDRLSVSAEQGDSALLFP